MYTWRALYYDGAILDETDGHVWADVDISRLQYIQIINIKWLPVLSVSVTGLPSGTVPEFFRRTSDTGDATCIGWPGAYVWFLDSGVMALTAGKEVAV